MTTLHLKLLTALLRLFPPSFQERYGAEMDAVLSERYRRAAEAGSGFRTNVYVARTAAELIGNAILAWGEALGRAHVLGTKLELRSIRRSLVRAPSFSVVFVLVVGLTVAMTTAVVGFYRGTLFREPFCPDPDRVVFAWGSNVTSGQLRDVVSGPNFLDFRSSTRTLENLAALHGSSAVIQRDGRPEVLDALDVTVDFLTVLNVAPALGDDFGDEHRSSGGPDAVILSHAFWRDGLGSSPHVLGTMLHLDGRAHLIVGVMGPSFEFLAPFALLRPLREDVLLQDDRTKHHYYLVGRLAPEATSADATRELSARFERIADEDDPRLSGWSVLVEPVRDATLEAVRPLLIAIGVGVLLVLVAASLNLATLTLVRTSSRSRELFVRTTLGAGRRDVNRIVLWETGLLAAGGAAIGLAAGSILLARLGEIVSPWIPIPGSAATVHALHGVSDGLVLIAGAAAAGVMWLLVVIPTLGHLHSTGWHRARASLRAPVRDWHSGARKLVTAELALATVLLVFAGLLIRTAEHLLAVDPGVEPGGLLTMYVGQLQDPDPASRARYFLDVVREVERAPGVVRAGVSDYVPFQGEDDFMGFRLADRPPPPPGQGFREEWRRVSEGFFEASGIDLRRGRGFERRDFEIAPAVAIVNEAFARKYWPNDVALGKRVHVALEEYGLLEVVGIVEDVPERGPALPPPAMFFVPLHGLPRDNMGLFVRVAGEPTEMIETVQQAVWSVDSSQPVERVHTMSALVDHAVALPRLARSLVAELAAIALFLAGLGLFGIVSYSVRLRRSELGIRLALGATPRRLQRDLTYDVAPLMLLGLAIGVTFGIGAGHAGRALLFGIPPHDPVTLAVTVAFALTVAFVATHLPARGVARIDPASTIRDG